jgi:ribonucleoside-diphosphate reductase alpha chain
MAEQPDWNKERQGVTHAVTIGGIKGYFVANPVDSDEDDRLFEIFVHGFGQMGSAVSGWTNAFAIILSLGIQSGLDIERFVPFLGQMKFEPSGETSNPDIPFCYSIPDYIARWLTKRYGSKELEHRLAQIHNEMASSSLS